MKVVYTQQPMPEQAQRSIFLAGPTPRDMNTPSWRPEALQELKKQGYDGIVFIPEFETGPFRGNYDEQVAWEELAMNRSDVILFWLPRQINTMPAFTTNDEWGWWKNSGKVVLGVPDNAEKTAYQKWWANHLQVPTANTLRQTISEAIKLLGAPINEDWRKGAECEIPLMIWRKPEFMRWYREQKQAGNRLTQARLLWTFRVGPDKNIVCFWALHVSVFVQNENRIKSNEIIIGRPDISSTVLYKRGDTLANTEVVLVREFRSAASTPGALVHELPGGSSPNGLFGEQLAIEELHEEIGFHKENIRLQYHGHRPLMATSSVHHGALFSLELSNDELEQLRQKQGMVFGETSSSERTYIEIRTVADILKKQDVDWSTIGQILAVLVQ